MAGFSVVTIALSNPQSLLPLLLEFARTVSFARAIAATVLISVTCVVWADKADDRAKAQLGELRARIAALEAEVTDTLSEQDSALRELQQLEQKLAESQREVDAVNEKLAQRKRSLVQLEQKQANAELSVVQQKDELARLLRSSYITGQQERIKLLLNQEDPAKVGRLLAYYEYFNKRRRQDILAIRSALSEIDGLKTGVEQEVANLRQLQGRQQRLLAALEMSRDERADLLQELKSTFADKEAERQRLEIDEKALRQLLKGVQTITKDLKSVAAPQPATKSLPRPKAIKRPKTPSAPFGKLRGKLHWPTAGKIRNSYGSPRANGKLVWNGVLIGASAGEPIYAIAPGRVVYADWLSRMGLLVVIDHGEGYMSLYGHTQSINVKLGDQVDVGDEIANVGDSGGHARPGLYFEIRKGAKHYNPILWCRHKALNG